MGDSKPFASIRAEAVQIYGSWEDLPGSRGPGDYIPMQVPSNSPFARGLNQSLTMQNSIYNRIAPNLKQVGIALGEYQDCVNKNPRAQEYREKLNVAAVRASIPIPGALSVGKTVSNSSRVYKAGKAVFTYQNVNKPILQGAVFALMLNSVFFSADAQILNNQLLRPWEEECKKQIQSKYGFRP